MAFSFEIICRIFLELFILNRETVHVPGVRLRGSHASSVVHPLLGEVALDPDAAPVGLLPVVHPLHQAGHLPPRRLDLLLHVPLRHHQRILWQYVEILI
jgi:hypothetical protein